MYTGSRPYESLIILTTTHTYQYFPVWVNLLSLLKVSSFVFSTGPGENLCVHELVVMKREEKPSQQQERRKNTSLQFLPMAFYHGLKALNVMQSKLGMLFFSCTRIKVNYISLLTGIEVWKMVKYSGGFYPFTERKSLKENTTSAEC